MHALASVAAAFSALIAVGAQADCVARSGPNTVALIELYTSEGCSSCPPADRWLSGLATGRIAAARAVPLALHVDYWDYIGWRDRFAQPRFGARQRESVARSGGSVVYTPQVLLNGRDFRGWRSPAELERALAAANARPARASLVVSAAADAAGAWTAQVSGDVLKPAAQAEVFLALYENALATQVKAGENSGASLRHDFVVREWVGPLASGQDGRIALRHRFAAREGIDFARAGVAAFVQDRASGEVLQAVSLPLCKDGGNPG